MQPHKYSRRILLAIIGRTPQIVTETLYKLAVDIKPAFVPTEIHLITTREGASSVRHALLGVRGSKGAFANFCSDYNMKDIAFSEKNIHIISNPAGLFIDDAQSCEHNRITADFITAKVREFTSDDNSALHLSLAGGRKTMSYYAGYALSLYGRMQDRLSHVLVAKPFQENKDFFYPPPKPKQITIDNVFYSTEDANIILSDIPFVRMRYHVPKALLQGKAGFQETVAAIQRFSQPETIEIDIAAKKVYLNGLQIEMNDADLAIYLWMCERNKNNEPPFIPDDDSFVEDYIKVYTKVVGIMSGMVDRVKKVAQKRTAEEQKSWFLSRKSKMKNAIEQVLGTRAAQPFLIQTIEYKRNKDNKRKVGYAVTMDSKAITIKERKPKGDYYEIA